jgi:hypothetical protein
VSIDDQNVNGINKHILDYRNRRSFDLREPSKHTYKVYKSYDYELIHTLNSKDTETDEFIKKFEEF